MQRVDGEHVLQIGDQQLLVLLLVVQADLDDRRQSVGVDAAQTGQQRRHVPVDVPAIRQHVSHPWGRASRPRRGRGLPLPHGRCSRN